MISKNIYSVIILLSIVIMFPSIGAAQVPVSWDSEAYYTNTYQQYWDRINGDSISVISEAVVIPPTLLSSNTLTNPFNPQEATGLSRLENLGSNLYSMTVDSSAANGLSDPGYSYTYTDNSTEFLGMFNAVSSVLNINYDYSYSFVSEGSELNSSAYSSALLYISVRDMSDGGIYLLDEYILDYNEVDDGIISPLPSYSGADSGMFSVAVPPGHDIQVSIWMEGESQAEYETYAEGSRTFSYSITVPEGITPDIKANNSDGPLTITEGDPLSITAELNAGDSTDNADWWILAETPFGWYYNNLSFGWQPGRLVTQQGPLFDLASDEVLNMSNLPLGSYTFYFGVDTNMNSVIDLGVMSYDSVNVDIHPTSTPSFY